MEKRKHMKFGTFIRKYGKVIIGGTIIGLVIFCAVFAPLITSFPPDKVDVSQAKLLPGGEHILGTDTYGRDLFSVVVYGSRTTLIVAVGAQLMIVVCGTVLGLLCGYYSKAEKILMRFLDAFSTIPNLLLCLLMISVFGAGTFNMIIAMSIHGIPGVARMVRNQVLSLREKEYIESEKAMGASDLRTVFMHILPACSSYLLVTFSNGLAGAILSMTALSYLGVGLDPTVASWGGAVQDGQRIMFAFPHVVLYPSLAICITVFGFSMLGDGLRDILDPKLR